MSWDEKLGIKFRYLMVNKKMECEASSIILGIKVIQFICKLIHTFSFT